MSVEIGDYLRQARESVGLSLDEVQEKTRIQKSFLEAIEKGDFDKLPSPFYVRTYLRSYANCVKVEPHYILREYRKKEQAERYQTGQFQVTELTQQLNKIEQTGMHRFGLTGTVPKVSPNTRPSAVNRTSVQTALTIANPTKANTGKFPNMQSHIELEKTSRAKVLSTNTNPERKFPSLLPSQALTTRSGSDALKEKWQKPTKENPVLKQPALESLTTAERTVPTQMYPSRLQKEQASPQTKVKQTTQSVPSRLTKSVESVSLSRKEAIQKQTIMETQTEQQLGSRETNPLSRTSRFRTTTSSLPTVAAKSSNENTIINEKTTAKYNTISKENKLSSKGTRLSRETGDHKEISEVQTLRRSTFRNRTAKSESFFSTRVIIACIAAVLLLGGVGWYLFSGHNKSDAVQEKNPVTQPKTEKKQLPAGGSTKNTLQNETNKGSLNKQSQGLFTLTGTDKVTIVMKPSGGSWVQIRTGREPTTDSKKYLKDVTLTAKDSMFKYEYTFSDVPDLYISIGSPDKVQVTVNGLTVSSTRIIHIVKK